MMIRTLLCGAAVLLGLGQQVVLGQPTLAVVHVPAVSERYNKTADLEAHFDAIRRKLNDERDALREKIERTSRSLEEQFKPGTDDYNRRLKELAMLQAELQYFVESEGKRIEGELAESLRSIFDDIHSVVRIVAEEKGIDIILAADQMPENPAETPVQARQQIMLQKVLYWSPRVDLTDEVVSKLNARYKAQGGKASISSAHMIVPDRLHADSSRPPQPGR